VISVHQDDRILVSPGPVSVKFAGFSGWIFPAELPSLAVAAPVILTLGHSSRSLPELVSILRGQRIATLVDVRRYAGSQRHPQFQKRTLGDALVFEGVQYFHEPDLGGMRKPRLDSPNNALDDAFRGYADHMTTREFKGAFERVASLAGRELVAVMCAEASHERCHRRYLADAFALGGFEVKHVVSPEQSVAHALHPALKRVEGELVYRIAKQLDLFR
jgi:uncharacterized protein (DUF488 family)